MARIGKRTEMIRRILVIEITGTKLSERQFKRDSLPVAFEAYDCFIGEELGGESPLLRPVRSGNV